MFYFLLVHVKKVMKFIYLLSEIFTHVYMIDFTEQQIYLLVMSKGINSLPVCLAHIVTKQDAVITNIATKRKQYWLL